MGFIMKSLITLLAIFTSIILTPPLSATEDSLKTLSRLFVYNSEGKTLLIKVKEGFWVTPAVHNKSADLMRPALDKLAASFGLNISAPELKGMFFVKYDFPKNQGLYNRIFFRVEHTGNNQVTLPESIVDYRWVSEEEALEMLSFPHITEAYRQIIAQPEHIWAGSFRFYLEGGKRKSEQIENFYSIR